MSAPAPYVGAHPWGKALTGFFASALSSRLVSFSAAVAVAAFGLLSVATIDEDYLRDSRSALYWPRDEVDDYAFASIEAKRAATTTGGRPSLVLVGTAAMREGLLPPADIEALLGHSVPVLNLMTGGQSPLEAAALVREVAPVTRGTLVLAVSPSRMAASGNELQGLLDHPRLAFSNEGLRREAEALGLRVPAQRGPYLWDNLQFYVIRLPSFVANWLSGEVPVNNVQTYLGRGQQSPESWDKDIATLAQRLSGYHANFPANIAPYRRLIRWVKENGYPLDVVLLEIPLNPRAITQAAGKDFYAAHMANLHAFCREEGCRYVNVNTRNLLGEEHFYDWSHVSSRRGKEIYTDAVLAEILGGK